MLDFTIHKVHGPYIILRDPFQQGKMAEGGGEERDDNPFSFKKFVKSKEHSKESDDSDSSDNQEKPVLDLPDISAGQGRERRFQGDGECHSLQYMRSYPGVQIFQR